MDVADVDGIDGGEGGVAEVGTDAIIDPDEVPATAQERLVRCCFVSAESWHCSTTSQGELTEEQVKSDYLDSNTRSH